MAAELDCDLLLVDAPREAARQSPRFGRPACAPCDVAASWSAAARRRGPVLVPFVRRAARLERRSSWGRGSRARGRCRYGSPARRGRRRDASRLLANASLAVQRALGVAAEPLLLAPGPDELVRAAQEAAIVVLGLSDRWQKEGLGKTARHSLRSRARRCFSSVAACGQAVWPRARA